MAGQESTGARGAKLSDTGARSTCAGLYRAHEGAHRAWGRGVKGTDGWAQSLELRVVKGALGSHVHHPLHRELRRCRGRHERARLAVTAPPAPVMLCTVVCFCVIWVDMG